MVNSRRGVENWENRKNRKRFCLLRKNRWCYDETDTTVGFSASNRSIYILKREANNSWRMCYWGGGLKIRKIEKIGNGFACYGRTGGAMMKRTPRLDSAHQIGLSTSSKGKLIIVGECVIGGGVQNRENRKNRKRFWLLWKNRWCYNETDTTVGFSESNRSIYILTRESNNSWRMCY